MSAIEPRCSGARIRDRWAALLPYQSIGGLGPCPNRTTCKSIVCRGELAMFDPIDLPNPKEH